MATARKFGTRSMPGALGSRRSFRVRNRPITSHACARAHKPPLKPMGSDRKDKGPASAFSEALGAEDLAIFNEVLAALFADLRDASTLCRDKKVSDRAATVIALGATY